MTPSARFTPGSLVRCHTVVVAWMMGGRVTDNVAFTFEQGDYGFVVCNVGYHYIQVIALGRLGWVNVGALEWIA